MLPSTVGPPLGGNILENLSSKTWGAGAGAGDGAGAGTGDGAGADSWAQAAIKDSDAITRTTQILATNLGNPFPFICASFSEEVVKPSLKLNIYSTLSASLIIRIF